MNVLVTGGAGYIGSVVADELLTAGHRVVVLDDLSRGQRAAVPRDAALVVGNLADRRTLDTTLQSHSGTGGIPTDTLERRESSPSGSSTAGRGRPALHQQGQDEFI